MRVLVGSAQAELVRLRSRFLGIIEPISDPEAARSRLKLAKERFADADHVVHAFRVGAEGSEIHGCGDDGEPSGTAGRPVLDVLSGQGGGNALLLVVRWFGGTKLGTGGLVQAYGDCAKAVIAAAVWEVQRDWVSASVTVTFAEHRILKTLLAGSEGRVAAEEFGVDVLVRASIPREALEDLQTRTLDLTRGRTSWATLG